MKDGWEGLRGAVLEDRDLPGLSPPEGGDREIDLAVAVEIRGIDAGNPGPAIEPERAELPLRQTAHPDDRPFGVIGGKELPHLGHQQILDAVLVDVRHRDVGRVRDAGDLRQGGRGRARGAAEDQPLTHVRAQQIELPVSVEIDQPHVRDRGSAGHSGNREHATCEGDR